MPRLLRGWAEWEEGAEWEGGKEDRGRQKPEEGGGTRAKGTGRRGKGGTEGRREDSALEEP
eukprot:9248988-Pyramimonas_sp.AAC.1